MTWCSFPFQRNWAHQRVHHQVFDVTQSLELSSQPLIISVFHLLRHRLRSSCPYWNTGQRVVSYEHNHWQCSWLNECHCHWHPFLANLLYMCPAMPALACPIFYFLPPESNLSTRLAGRDVGKRSTCPMNLLRLSATMSCRSPMPGLDSSSFVMWSFHDTPIMSRRHLLLNTLSILFVLSAVLHVSLAQMADGMTTDVYRRIFVFLLIFLTATLGEEVCALMKLSLFVCICHGRHHRLLICCCQGTESAPQTLMSLCLILRDRACVFPTTIAFVFSALIHSPTLAALPCNSVVIFCNATGESLIVLLRSQNVSCRSVSVGFAEKTSVFSSV